MRQAISALLVLVVVVAGGWLAYQTYQVSVQVEAPPLASGPQIVRPEPMRPRVLPQQGMTPDPAITRLQFEPFTVDEPKLTAERAAQQAPAQSLSAQAPALTALAAAMRAWGLRGEGEQAKAATLTLEAAAQAVLSQHGEAALALVVEAARADFEAMLLAKVNPSPPQPPQPPAQGVSRWLSTVSGAAVAAALREVGLEVPQFAREVYTPEGLDTLWPMVGVLFRYQWSQRLCGKGTPCLLTPYERLLLRRWQVERSRATLPQKVKAIQRARQEVPTYDWLRAEVTLLDQAGLRDEARRLLSDALPSADPALAPSLKALADTLAP